MEIRVMRKACVLVACVVALAFVVAPALAGEDCSCTEIKKAGYGFCKGCEKGTIFGVKLTSAKLYDALAGTEVDVSKIKCESCKAAAEKNGVCTKCNVGMADKHLYHSLAAHTLALGESVDKESIKCEGCRKASDNDGFCDESDTGTVAGRWFKPRKVYDEAKTAHELIAKAAGVKCEGCAVAMVKDGTCASCKVAYKAGKKV